MPGVDNSHNSPKKDRYSLRSKKRDTKNQNKRKQSSDSESSTSEDDYDEEDEEEQELNQLQYRKFLSKLFPSRFINRRIEELQEEEDIDDDDEDEDEDYVPSKKRSSKKSTARFKTSASKRRKNKVISETESEEEEEDYDEEDEEEINDEQNINIIFTLGQPTVHYGKYDDYEEEVDSEDYDEDEDDYENELEHLEGDETESSSEEEEVKHKSRRKQKGKSTSKKELPEELEGLNEELGELVSALEKEASSCKNEIIDESKPQTDKDIIKKFISMAKECKGVNKKSRVVKELIEIGEEKLKDIEKEETAKERKAKLKNLKRFRKGVTEKNVMNDYAFFTKMTLEKQSKLLDELDEINRTSRVDKPYRLKLLECDIPTKFKSVAIKKINSLRFMEPGAGEYYKFKLWVDTFMRIPFNTHTSLPVSRKGNTIEECHNFMEDAKKHLDQAVYGLNDAKLQIMQMVGQWISNPDAVGTAIAIKGPMGTGKTTLIKEGISKILKRDFAFIALGGATDSSFLEGHGYTYEGSTWGKIVDIIIQSGSMNPVIYFDELDKVSDTPKGEEIISILTHLTDTSQNDKFHDKYFAEIDFDLSKCLFIFSYNDESKVNPILRDRMYRIQTKGYDKKQKNIIAKDYLLPSIKKTVDFNDEDVIIPQETIDYINENFTMGEDGVRNLKRCLEIIYTKLNLYRLMKPGTNLFEEDMSLEVSFPFTVTTEIVNKLLKKDETGTSHMSMYM